MNISFVTIQNWILILNLQTIILLNKNRLPEHFWTVYPIGIIIGILQINPAYLSSANAFPLCFKAAWAAAKRAMGTRNGEQLT